MIYIDNPVGTGFSFTSGGYAENETAVADDLFDCIIQLFTLFPEFEALFLLLLLPVGLNFGGNSQKRPAINRAIFSGLFFALVSMAACPIGWPFIQVSQGFEVDQKRKVTDKFPVYIFIT